MAFLFENIVEKSENKWKMPMNAILRKRNICLGILFDMKTIFIGNYSQQEMQRISQSAQKVTENRYVVVLCVCGDSGLNVT